MTDHGHASLLRDCGIPAASIEPLDTYLGLVASWNERTNLTAARSPGDRVRILIEDPWRAAAMIRRGSLVDVGSGNGSPGLVLALLRPDLSVTLLEPRARRWAFLREATRALSRSDIDVERARCEEFETSAQTATIQAVGIELGSVARLVEPGGDLFVFGGTPDADRPLVRLGAVRLERSDLHVFRKTVVSDVSRET